jgi:hypothetical protein
VDHITHHCHMSSHIVAHHTHTHTPHACTHIPSSHLAAPTMVIPPTWIRVTGIFTHSCNLQKAQSCQSINYFSNIYSLFKQFNVYFYNFLHTHFFCCNNLQLLKPALLDMNSMDTYLIFFFSCYISMIYPQLRILSPRHYSSLMLLVLLLTILLATTFKILWWSLCWCKQVV